MSENGDMTQITPPHVADSEADDLDGSENEEVILRTLPEVPVTRTDIRELMNDWEEKLNKITEGLRAVEMNTHEVHTHMDIVMRENRASETAQVSTNGVDQGSPRTLHGDLQPSASSTCENLCEILCAHSGDVRPSVSTRPYSNTRRHVRATSHAHDEHVNLAAGSTGIFLLVACEPGHTRGAHAQRQRPRPQRATDARKWKWDWK